MRDQCLGLEHSETALSISGTASMLLMLGEVSEWSYFVTWAVGMISLYICNGSSRRLRAWQRRRSSYAGMHSGWNTHR